MAARARARELMMPAWEVLEASTRMVASFAEEYGKSIFKLDPGSREHGVPHWRAVLTHGLAIARTEGVRRQQELDAIAWFAMLHDSCRTNDNYSHDHGYRAAQRAYWLFREGELAGVDNVAFPALWEALAWHSDGGIEGALLTRICWDADRLDLIRFGIVPDAHRMSTRHGQWRARAIAARYAEKAKSACASSGNLDII